VLYQPILVIHVTAAALLVGGGLLLAASGFGLVGLERVRELLPWVRLALASAPMTLGAGLLLFASGGHLAGTQWSFEEGWITVSAAVLAVLGVATLVLYRRLWRLLEEVRGAGRAEVPPALRARLAAPGLWVIAHALVVSGPAFIAVMVLKTSYGETAAWLLGAVLVGAGSGAAFSRWGSRVRLAAHEPAR
jgi:hypothetical protein